MIDNNYIEKLATAINEAQIDIKKIRVDDGGACNLDTVMINCDGWKTKEINLLKKLSNVEIGDKMKGWNAGNRFIHFDVDGMANLRNSQVELAKSILKGKGFDVSVWYHMD